MFSLFPYQVERTVRDTFPVLVITPNPNAALRTEMLQYVENSSEEKLALPLQCETLGDRTPRQLLAHILSLLETSPTDSQLYILRIFIKKFSSLSSRYHSSQCPFYSFARNCSYSRTCLEQFFPLFK